MCRPSSAAISTASAHIASSVVFTGEVAHEDIPNYYALIDLFVIPRVADFASDFVTPMKPFEAMAMRRPLLVSDRPALIEIVGEHEQRGRPRLSEREADRRAHEGRRARRRGDGGEGSGGERPGEAGARRQRLSSAGKTATDGDGP